jgi:hypothetical protein
MTKGYFEFEYLKRRDLKDEVQKVVQNYLNIYNSVSGTVDYFADLPNASLNNAKIYLVRYQTTVLGIITKQSGLYISEEGGWRWMTSLDEKANKNITISAGSGLIGGGSIATNRTISHADTSSQANIVNTGGNVIQSANLDDFGHITSFSSIDLDNRYITTSGAYANPTWITSLDANKLTGTIPSNVLGASTLYIGTTEIALNRASGNQALTGISSVQFTGATSGTATLQAPAIAGTTTFTLPATSGNLIGSNDTTVNNWNTSYNRSPTALSVAGTTTKTITLTKQDGTTLSANWTDLSGGNVTSVFGRTGAVVATEGDYSLNLLSDTTIATPTTNQLLRYDGTNWVNWTANYLTLTSLSATSPLNYNNTTGVFSIDQSNTTTNGFLSSVDWNTFNNKQNAITLTTTGNSGASSFVSNVLNIPNYTLAGLGGQPLLSGTGFVKANGTVISYDNSTYLTTNQTITLTGDITGSGTTAITTALANSGVVAGTYQDSTTISPLTIDAKGRITSTGTAVTIAPLFSSIASKPTTISGYGITDGATLTGTETLTNKTLTDNTTFFQDHSDNTKKAQFELSSITTATTRTYTLPNNDGTLITHQQYTATDVLNKIKTVDGTGSGLDADTLQGLTLSSTAASGPNYNSIPYITAGGVIEIGRYIDFHASSSDGNDYTARLDAGSAATSRTLSLPTSSGTLISTGGNGVVTNTMLAQITAANKVANTATTATALGSTSTIVARNANNAFACANIALTGIVYEGNSGYSNINTTSSITIANILNLVIQSTPTSNITLTLPTGILVEGGVIQNPVMANNSSFIWSIVNIATGFTITLAGATGHTYIGNITISADASATFRTQRTATNVYKTVRI